MKPIWYLLLCLLLLLPAAQPAAGAHLQAAETAPLTCWHVGFMLTVQPSAANLTNLPASAAVRVLSSALQEHVFFVVPASTLTKVVQVRLVVFDRSGSYGGDYFANLEVYDTAGIYRRDLGTAVLNLQTATENSWTLMPLIDAPYLAADERLVVHISRSAGAAGDLSLGLGMDVEMMTEHTLFFPIIVK